MVNLQDNRNRKSLYRALRLGILPVAFLVLLLPYGCKTEEIPSSWTNQPITVDGNADDWSELPAYLFEKEGATVGICNDSVNLYLMLRLSDARKSMMIKREGLTIWLDDSGKKNKDFMIRFRGGPSLAEFADSSDTLGQRGRWMRHEFEGPEGGLGREPRDPFTCYIKDRIVENAIATDGSNGPAAAFGLESRSPVYEFSIPLDSGHVLFYGLGIEPGHVLGVGFEWSEPKESQHSVEREMPYGSPPRGGGGFPGDVGGMPPGGDRGDRPEGGRGFQSQKREIWFTTRLASSPQQAGESVSSED
jgi:hypothetical protein